VGRNLRQARLSSTDNLDNKVAARALMPIDLLAASLFLTYRLTSRNFIKSA